MSSQGGENIKRLERFLTTLYFICVLCIFIQDLQRLVSIATFNLKFVYVSIFASTLKL